MRAVFLDDSLVALRYEKTVAAEPPVPIPARSPLRISRSLSSNSRVSRSSSTSNASSSYSPGLGAYRTPPFWPSPPSSSATSHSPLPRHLQGPIVVAPPAEEHPALRASALAVLPCGKVGDRRRDSGHGPTTSPSPTIPEECETEDCAITAKSPVQQDMEDRAEMSRGPSRSPVVRSPTAKSDTFANGFGAHCLGQPRRTVADEDSDADARAADVGRSKRVASNIVAAGAYSPGSPPSTCVPISPTRPTPVIQSALPSGRSTSSSPITSRPKSSLIKTLSRRSASLIRPSRLRAPSSDQEDNQRPLTSSPDVARATSEMRGAPESPTTSHSAPNSPAATPKKQLDRPKSPGTASRRLWSRSRTPDSDALSAASSTISDAPGFSPLEIAIPNDSLLEDDFMTALSFSKRGSVMLGGRRPTRQATDAPSSGQPIDQDLSRRPGSSDNLNGATQDQSTPLPQLDGAADTPQTAAAPSTPPSTSMRTPDILLVDADMEKESQKVRSLYAGGDAGRGRGNGLCSSPKRLGTLVADVDRAAEEEEEKDSVPSLARVTHLSGTSRSGSTYSLHADSMSKETESAMTAGGFEDMDDLEGAHVDRYGFITELRPASSRLGTPTELKSVHFSPRRRNVLQKRDQSGFSSPLAAGRSPSRKMSARSLNTQNSGRSAAPSFRSSRSVMRQAGNLLPHNRDRRWMDEASEMLTVAPSFQNIVEEMQVEKMSEAVKKKEWERAEKWRKMAKVLKNGSGGGDPKGKGMEFEFDSKNPKLIERTWKGIPDRWRAAAWWSFLATSARSENAKGAGVVVASEEQIIADFHRSQPRSSPDDVQIDLDVPRTIGRHVMFRKRYSGGQRLLFRVLHALSIYFPTTGYVQGMASLAATLLCYFDEEKTFVMLVRMWILRGLDRLYQPGFEGLMMALREFEGSWLNKDVAKILSGHCVDATAYGTRWYLTLFNLSIPFPAQLRVWDVFLLLGVTPTSETTGLDVLHAASAALIQALRELLLDSDFENVMKALTSWISIKDEDLLMKVTKAEWKSHQGKKRGF